MHPKRSQAAMHRAGKVTRRRLHMTTPQNSVAALSGLGYELAAACSPCMLRGCACQPGLYPVPVRLMHSVVVCGEVVNVHTYSIDREITDTFVHHLKPIRARCT